MKTFVGEWIDHLGLSPEKVAEASGVSAKIIAKWLKEETTPSLSQLDLVSRAIGVSIDDLTRTDPKGVIKTVDVGESTPEVPVVSTFIKEWAEKFEVTAEEISSKTKIPADSIQKWIDKKSNPTLVEASIVAASFGLTVDDLLKKDPSSFYNDYLDNHYFETKNIKVAVRVQNWLDEHRIKNEVVVFRGNDGEIFMVRYTNSYPLDPIDIVRISFRRKYRDIREKTDMKVWAQRYKRMEIVEF